jgi:hypothetical protein
VSSIALVPQYTLDQSTVHRALLVVSVPAALWLAAVLTDAVADPVPADVGTRPPRPHGSEGGGRGREGT